MPVRILNVQACTWNESRVVLV